MGFPLKQRAYEFFFFWRTPAKVWSNSKSGYYSGGEGGGTFKGKNSAQINPWRVVDFSAQISQSSLGNSLTASLLYWVRNLGKIWYTLFDSLLFVKILTGKKYWDHKPSNYMLTTDKSFSVWSKKNKLPSPFMVNVLQSAGLLLGWKRSNYHVFISQDSHKIMCLITSPSLPISSTF